MEIEERIAPPQLILASPRGPSKLVAIARRNMLLGRGAGNDLVLDSELASRRHAALRVEGPFVTLTDLGSRNGTFVNGSRVKSAVLVDRDLIEIGDCLLRFIAFDQEAVAAEAMTTMVARGGQLYQQRQPMR